MELATLRRVVRAVGLGRLVYRSVIQPLSRLRRLRLPDRNCLVDVHGFDFEVLSPRRNRIGEALYRTRVWEERVTAVVRGTIRPEMNVVDAGADVGYYTLLAARLAAPGRVFAFEPIPRARCTLERNLERNGLENVSVFECALGAETRTAWLRAPLDLSRIDLTNGVGGPDDIEVSIRAFDDVAAELGIERVAFVKVDVEGAEHEVLRGMEKTIARDRPIFLFEIHGALLPLFGTDKSALVKSMECRGYHWRWVDGEPVEAPGTSTLLFEPRATRR